MLQQISKLFLILICLTTSGCALFESRPDAPDKIIEKASQQKIFFADYDLVWKSAHTVIRYTIANENQEYGVIETDYIKAVDGWLPPFQSKPQYKSGRYKLIFTFAKTETNGRPSTRLTIEKKIEVFKDFISETQTVVSDGLEEQALFYRIERELVVGAALKKANAVIQ